MKKRTMRDWIIIAIWTAAAMSAVYNTFTRPIDLDGPHRGDGYYMVR